MAPGATTGCTAWGETHIGILRRGRPTSLGKSSILGKMRQLELLAESFNLFDHQNVTELETVGYSIEPGSVNGSLPTLNFLTGLKTGQTKFGQPLNINATNFYRQRQMQFGMRIRF